MLNKEEVLIFECIVCSKAFRGGSDLRRHQWGISIQHFTSADPHPSYPYQCSRCNFYFKSKEQLKQHEDFHFDRCNESRPISPLSRKMYHHADDETRSKHMEEEWDQNKILATRSRRPKEFPSSQDSVNSSSNTPSSNTTSTSTASTSTTSNTPILIPKLQIVTIASGMEKYVIKSDRRYHTPFECMVCGKLFHHGPQDLERHKTAITLRHLYSNEKSPTCKILCDRCGLFFSEEDHLHSHKMQSSCNPDYIPPISATTPRSMANPSSPSKTISSASSASPAFVPALGSPLSSLLSSSSRSMRSTNDMESKSFKSQNIPESSRSMIPSSRSSISSVRQGRDMSNSHTDNHTSADLDSSFRKGSKRFFPERNTFVFDSWESVTNRPKRTRMLIPQASLLIDPTLIPPGLQLTAENFEEYIPENKRGPIDKLKQ